MKGSELPAVGASSGIVGCIVADDGLGRVGSDEERTMSLLSMTREGEEDCKG